MSVINKLASQRCPRHVELDLNIEKKKLNILDLNPNVHARDIHGRRICLSFTC